METDSELGKRVRREFESHTTSDVLGESYKLKDRFSHIWTYPSRQRLFALIEHHLDNLSGKTVLDYGCGRGEASLGYIERGSSVVGIDISPVYIEEANNAAEKAGISKELCSFRVMDAHKLDFDDNQFDLVVGYGILHHLDPDIALTEIHRVLKPNGRVLLQEPLADNPLLKLFRVLTPKARTEDEAPFSSKDLHRLTNGEKWHTEMAYCGIFEAPAAMLTSLLLPSHPENAILRFADRFERWTHERNILTGWNQYVLFNMVKR